MRAPEELAGSPGLSAHPFIALINPSTPTTLPDWLKSMPLSPWWWTWATASHSQGPDIHHCTILVPWAKRNKKKTSTYKRVTKKQKYIQVSANVDMTFGSSEFFYRRTIFFHKLIISSGSCSPPPHSLILYWSPPSQWDFKLICNYTYTQGMRKKWPNYRPNGCPQAIIQLLQPLEWLHKKDGVYPLLLRFSCNLPPHSVILLYSLEWFQNMHLEVLQRKWVTGVSSKCKL